MKVSVLNLAPVRQGKTYKDAMDEMVRLAQKVEQLGYERYWIAEHHNMPSIASSATQLLIQHTLANTETLRVGSGGIMLPNHSPYLVAEQFGTLETLYPGRVDLGLGRAPGTDMQTARAIRRSDHLNPAFPEDLELLRRYFAGEGEVKAYPAAGLNVPFYILGSSTDSAYLAAELGLPYSFASHFAPRMMDEAITIYRHRFKPSAVLDKPYVILGANAVLADTDAEAHRLATTQLQSFISIVSGTPKGLMPPMENSAAVWEDFVATNKVPHFGPVALKLEHIANRERQIVEMMSEISLIGSPATVKEELKRLMDRVTFDEIMVNSYIYDEEAQHRSYELLAEVIQDINQ